MVTILVPLAVAVIGLALWWGSASSKVSDAGRILFAVGSFFTVWAVSGRFLHLP